MRIRLLLLIVGVCAVSAKYESNESGDPLLSDRNKEDKSNQVDLWETKIQEKIQKQLEKNEKKHEAHQKYQEKLAQEKKLAMQKKLQKQWKLTQKAETEEAERKRLEKIQSVLDRLDKDSIEKQQLPAKSNNKDDDVNLHSNWKNYVYKKYGLTELSGNIEKKAALIRYVYEELSGRNAYSSEAISNSASALEYTAAVATSTVASPVVAVALNAPSVSDATIIPMVPTAPTESTAAPRVHAANDAVGSPEAADDVETSSVPWPVATPSNMYPYLLPYKPYFD